MSLGLLENSLVVACGATLLALCLGSLAALCLAGLGRRWRGGLLAVAIISLAFPPFLVTNAWLQAHQVRWVPVRFDVLAVVAEPGAPVTVQHYEAAF